MKKAWRSLYSSFESNYMEIKCRTGKIVFHNSKAARKVINQQKASRKAIQNPSKYYYLCEFCEGYHLTSKTKSQVKRNNKLSAEQSKRIKFITELKENDTVSWYLANAVRWIELEYVDDQKALAHFVAGNEPRCIVLRNI